MSAPTSATGDGNPAPGYYPDPSIPGYVRYWNGAAWVPGSSRPAPPGAEAPPSGAQPVPAVEETGPVFFDEEPQAAEQPRQEPASAWQADVSRQTGFGGERDNRVSWGAPDPRVPAPAPEPGAPRRDIPFPAPVDPTGGALPGVRALGPGTGDSQPVIDGTVAIRAMRRGIAPGPGPAPGAGPGTGVGPGTGTGPGADTGDRRGGTGTGESGTDRPAALPGQIPSAGAQQPPVDSTVAIRALRAARRAKDEDAAAGRTGEADGALSVRSMTPGAAGAGTVPPPSRNESERQASAASSVPAPSAAQPQQGGAGGGSASWAQQVHQLAQPAGEQPVVPWKPPVSDPFLQAAQAQAAARPAGLGKRLVARLIDTLVLGALVGAVALPLAAKARTHVDDKIEAAKRTGETVTVWLLDSTTAGYLGAVLGALLVLGVLYEALPTAKWGRTLGKKLCGLQVRDIESHEAPAFGAALRRWLLYGVLGLLVVGVLNVLWCLFDRPWRQCWHDKAAHTFVAG
ncbi:RDD family protein [Streptomyces liangshanensis]|uniref:RDD family protein n=1 Tax=Streptomyces liangshanensis TaxID=2717324 RepID=UPI0036DEF555